MARTYQRITNQYEGLPPDTKEYLNVIPLIIDISNNVSRDKDKDIFDILLAYLFIRVEHGQRRILRGLAINEHNVKSSEAEDIVNKWHINQLEFIILHKIFTGKLIKPKILEYKRKATDVRNNIIHGKIVTDAEKAQAIKDILNYIEKLNDLVRLKYKFKPFGNMKGFRVSSEPNNDYESNRTLEYIWTRSEQIKDRYKSLKSAQRRANQ